VLVVPFFVVLVSLFSGARGGQVFRSEVGGQRKRRSTRKTRVRCVQTSVLVLLDVDCLVSVGGEGGGRSERGSGLRGHQLLQFLA
jgi:hypothetical protein